MALSFLRVSPHDTVLMEWVYRVRYQVYCIECGFENPQNYPNGMEWDKYDPYSIHFIALNDHDGGCWYRAADYGFSDGVSDRRALSDR